MGAGIIALLVGKLLPMVKLKKGKLSVNAKEQPQENTAMLIIKTIGYWGILAMLLYAMSKGILSFTDVEHLIEVIKE